MGQILVRIDDDIEKEVRRLVQDRYGGRRGVLSLIVEEALRQVINPPAEVSTSTLLEVIDYVMRAAKDNASKEEILTNIFIMLDREFEQSIIRGVEDLEQGRYQEIPEGEDAIRYLRRIVESK